MFRYILVLSSLIILSSCTSGHIYNSKGGCLTCVNNPFTSEPINYDKKMSKRDKNNNSRNESFDSPILSWHELMLEGLTQKNNIDDKSAEDYAEDYLKYLAGIKYLKLRENEFSYRKALEDAKQKLIEKLNAHYQSTTYQFTLSSQLGEYDFSRLEFPVQTFTKHKVSGPSNGIFLPQYISINLLNSDDIPALQMSSQEAQSFLNARKNSRSIYLRYIIKLEKMHDQKSFDAVVVKVQYIDQKPSIITSDNKERYPPFKISNVIED